jgi:competence protein ComEA
MTFRESVLVAIAFVLLAGIIAYNAVTLSSSEEGDVLESVSASVSTSSSASFSETESTTSQSSEGTTEGTTSVTISVTAGKVNINTAGLDELTTLTGIGEVKGQAIIDYRTEHGPFASVDELTNVSGIGDKTLAKIRDQITV